MDQIPAFNVRSYASFRLPRLYRVYVDRDALYLIRMRGVIGFGDADPLRGPAGDPLSFLFSALAIRLIVWWARWSQDAQARRLDPRGPRELLGAHRGNLRIEPGELAESRLVCLELSAGSWSLTRRRRRALRFWIEDGASLKTALEHLPRLLGPALDVSVSKDIASKPAVRDDDFLG